MCNCNISDSWCSQSLQSQKMLGTGTHSSSTISFDPGLDQGVPWGRDLFTFVTSAAGYMMRTLQKPRKNKPSKRQVNHRRFLHNMIQRKFAEIEAANHQLASALFSVDTESQAQSDVKSAHKSQSDKNKKKATGIPGENEVPAQQHAEDNSRTLDGPADSLNKSVTRTNPLNNRNHATNNQPFKGGEQLEHGHLSLLEEITDFTCEREHVEGAPADLGNLTQTSILEDGDSTSLELFERMKQNLNPHIKSPDKDKYLGLSVLDVSSISPVSPLSLDSYDFDIQMQPDSDSQMQQVLEALQMDVMENLEQLDSSVYLQSHHNDQTAMDTEPWTIQDDEDQGCFQDSVTFLNCIVKGGSDGELTGLQHITTLLENPAKDVNTEIDLRGEITHLANCGSSCHQNQAGYGQTTAATDCYFIQPKINQYIASGSWTTPETMPKVFDRDNLLNHILECQPEHAYQAKIQNKYWDQQHIPKDYSQDSCYLLTDIEKSSTETRPTLNPNSDYPSSENPLSSTAHCYDFDLAPQPRISCRGAPRSYDDFERDLNIPTFVGVAQSFPASMHNPHPHPVLTPPLHADWLFSNIVAEEDFTAMVRSPGLSYC